MVTDEMDQAAIAAMINEWSRLDGGLIPQESVLRMIHETMWAALDAAWEVFAEQG